MILHQNKPHAKMGGFPVFYNLDNPKRPIARPPHESPLSLQLPSVGEYESGFVQDYTDLYMGVRLPKSQLVHFPKEMHDRFREKKNVELFSLVFKDIGNAETSARNLSMHRMALPEYRNDANEAHMTSMRIKIYEPQGVSEYQDKSSAIPLKGDTKSLQIHIHPGKEDQQFAAFSPNNARFNLDEEVASFYFSSEFRGKSVLAHVLILQKPDSGEGKKVLDAIAKPSVADFVEHLKKNNFVYSEAIEQTFKDS